MPEEPVTLVKANGEEQKIKAYLVETHSVGGLSGSPVFANPMNLDANSKLHAMHIWIGLCPVIGILILTERKNSKSIPALRLSHQKNLFGMFYSIRG